MEIKSVALADLNLYPNNPRKGNVDIIAESLDTYGQYKPITVNSRNNEILAGNHTYQAAQLLDWPTIDVVFVDVDDTTAAKIVAIDNRASDQGEYDNEVLLELLKDLPTLEGTGYGDSDLDDLKALLEESALPVIDHDFVQAQVGVEGNSNAVIRPSLDDYAQRYNQKASRMLVADYQNDTFIWVIEKLLAYRAENNVETNAQAIVHLLETKYGEKAPE